MNNLFNKGQRVPSLIEEALLGKMYDEPKEDENNKPKTNVVINTNREWYGKNSTVSTFIATAYNEDGEKIDSMKGYFLEPHVNYDSAKIANSKKAIMYGTYNVVSKAELENRINAERRKRGEPSIQLTYKWYVDSVPGRSGIAIHTGNYGKDTKGCFLPGDSYSFDEMTETYNVWNSKKKTKELFDFFDNYGKNGIKINVPH